MQNSRVFSRHIPAPIRYVVSQHHCSTAAVDEKMATKVIGLEYNGVNNAVWSDGLCGLKLPFYYYSVLLSTLPIINSIMNVVCGTRLHVCHFHDCFFATSTVS